MAGRWAGEGSILSSGLIGHFWGGEGMLASAPVRRQCHVY